MINNLNDEIVLVVEQKLISEILNDANRVEDAVIKLEPADFLDKNMAVIFGAIRELYKDARAIDEYTVINVIKSHPDMAFDDYELIVKNCAHQFTTSVEIDDHIDLVKNASIKRQMVNFANVLLTTPIDITRFDEQLFTLQDQFAKIASSKHSSRIANMEDITKRYQEHLWQIMNHTGDITGTTTGFSQIDNKTSGLQNGDLIILAARPGIGKTALAINFLVNAAKDINQRKKIDPSINECVLMFSLEMSTNEICNRMVANLSGVELSNTRRSKALDKISFSTVQVAIEEVSKLPILIDDDSSLTIMDIQNKVKQLSQLHTIKLVVVDYLGLVKSPNNINAQNRQLEIALFSRLLKQTARINNVPMLVLAQLNRNVDQRRGGENAKPMLSDLRDSGAIEQDADIVAFLSKMVPDDETQGDETTVDDSVVMVDFHIAKNRKGPEGNINMAFYKKTTTFVEQQPLNISNKGMKPWKDKN